MLSKFSVKYPFTVLVGVIMIIVIGFVSVTNLKSDLLPSMNMPYSVVYTSYYGASPEEVEEQVTRPVESAMATISNIENITSVSSENVSMVILEFNDSADMDSISVEMQQTIDQVKATWSDSIGNPIIMNINPDMIPVIVAAVNVEGYEGAALNDYVNDNLLSKLESIDGVASVTASGGIEESVNVTINPDKLEQMNEKVKAALDSQFSDAKSQISSAKSQINSGLSQVENGEAAINSAKSEIASKQTELSTELESAKADADSQLQEIIETKIELNNKLSELTTQKESIVSQLKYYQDLYDKSEDESKKFEYAEKIAQLNIALNQVNDAIDTIETTLTNLESGKIQLEQAKLQLSIQESTAQYQLYSTLADTTAKGSTLSSTKSTLESSLSQLNESESTLNDTISNTYEKTDLNTLITKTLISQMLTAQNFSMPSGYVLDNEGEDVIVRVGDKLSSTEDVESLVLMDLGIDGLDPIRISDVCDVETVDNSSDVYAKIDGQDGILLTFEKQTGYSTSDVTDKIQETFNDLSENGNVSFSVLMDQGIYINYITSSVFDNLLWGALFAIVILLIFLRSIKPTLIVAVSIPVSLLFAIICMYFSGINLNIISLSGLALSVGMLVDNSIVVIENIYRLRGLGVPLRKAAILGAKQVAGAIIASTLTTVCVFFPIVFTTGLTRQLFVDLGLTIAYSLGASLIIALTVVPAMSTGLLNSAPTKENKFTNKLQNAYGKSINFALDHKALMIIGAVVILVVSAFFAYKSGTSFMPTMESTQLTLEITPPEDATFEEATALGDEVYDRIKDIEGITSIGAMAGNTSYAGMSTSSSDDNTITEYLVLSEDKSLSNSEITKEIEERTSDLDCKVEVSSSMSEMTSIFGEGISISVTGDDLDALQSSAKDIAANLANIEGIEEVDDGIGETTPQLHITIDKDKASKYNLTVAQIYQQISAKIGTSSSSTTLSTDDKDYDVFVYDGAGEDYTTEDVMAMNITATDTSGDSKEVALGDIATFEASSSMNSIRRENQTRKITVKATLKDGYNQGNVSNEVQDMLDDMSLSSGINATLSGLTESINDTLSQILLMLALAVLLVYLVMVAQFQSLVMPFIIMFTIPLSFTGGFIALLISGLDLSVISMLGFVILTGVIVNNGIVLVDYVNQLRLSGMSKRQALVEAGKTRLRPILMTALTTILGLIMMALAVGMGADMTQPMAVVTIGGLLYGTLTTLLIVPCIYDIFTGKRELKNRQKDLEDIDKIDVDKIYIDVKDVESNDI